MVKKAEVFRIYQTKKHIEDFFFKHLNDVLSSLSRQGLIECYYFVNPKSIEFYRGVDFYVFIDDIGYPVQLTDEEENFRIFSEKGILVIFIPERDRKNRILSAEEKKKIVAREIENSYCQKRA
jgi:hypothetical protein